MKKWRPALAPFRRYKKEVYDKIGKVSNFVYQIGESDLLRNKSKVVPRNKIKSEEFQQKLSYIKKCIVKYRRLTGVGRGITAVQVGIPERFSVVYTPEKLIIIINPKITRRSSTLLKFPEICMSANPIIAPIIRPSWVEFNYFDEQGKLQHWKTKDKTNKDKILNRVFQHEIDHMDGIICIDKVASRELVLESDPKFYKKAKPKEAK